MCIERAVFYFTATADPFRVGVRAATAAAPLYVHASIRVGSATADQIVPLHKICAVQWYIGLVAQRSCVAAATASAAASAAASALRFSFPTAAKCSRDCGQSRHCGQNRHCGHMKEWRRIATAIHSVCPAWLNSERVGIAHIPSSERAATATAANGQTRSSSPTAIPLPAAPDLPVFCRLPRWP